MFLVEPMVARMVCPGSVARRRCGARVWCSSRRCCFLATPTPSACPSVSRGGRSWSMSPVVLPSAALALPLDFGAGAPQPGASPAAWLLIRLAVVAGPPVFAISATAPLLQRWFADVHEAAHDPYFLYAVSNAGSLLALLAYLPAGGTYDALDRQASYGPGALVLWRWGLRFAPPRSLYGRGPMFRWPARSRARPAIRVSALAWITLSFVPSLVSARFTTPHITADMSLPRRCFGWRH